MSSEAATALQTKARLCSDDRLLRSAMGVKITAVRSRRDEAHAQKKFAEGLAVRAQPRIGREQGLKRLDDGFVLDVLGIELREPRAVEGTAEIKIVTARAFADQADLGEVRPRAAVRAAGHAEDDVFSRKPVRLQPLLERRDEIGEIALAFREREAAGRERNTGHRI